MKDPFTEIMKKSFTKEELKKFENWDRDISETDIDFAERKAEEEIALCKRAFKEFNAKIKETSLSKELKWVFLHFAETLVTLQDLIEFKDRKKFMEKEKEVYIHIQSYRSKIFSNILKKYKRGKND